MAQFTRRLNLRKPDGNDLIKRQDFNENWEKIDEGIVEIESKIEEHKNDKNNPHNVSWEQVGAAPLHHTHKGIVEIESKIEEHKNDKNNPHNVSWEQVGAAPLHHTHNGSDITSAVADADTVDGKHANGQPNNLLVLDSNGLVSLIYLPLGHGGGIDADTVDGRHAEDLRGYNFVEQGYCLSGTRIYKQYQDFRVALIPLIDRFPLNLPYFEAPTTLSVSGGRAQQGAVTYIAVQGVSPEGKRGAWAQYIYEGYYPDATYPISVSWSPVVGASSYKVYVANSYGAWKLYTTTSTTSCNIGGITGSLEMPTYDYAPQFLRLEYNAYSDGFTPFFEVYKLNGQESVNIGVSKTLGQSYQWQTSRLTAANIALRMNWTLNWSGFSGECTWGVRFRIRWKRQSDSNWLGTKTFEYQETWGSQWFGGRKAFSKDYSLNLYNLSKDIYIFEVYDIQEWLNNSNYWFNPHNTVYIDTAIYQTEEKIADLYGIYLIFVR